MCPGVSVLLTPSLGIHHPISLGKTETKSLDCSSGLHSVSPLQEDRTGNTLILSQDRVKVLTLQQSEFTFHGKKMGRQAGARMPSRRGTTVFNVLRFCSYQHISAFTALSSPCWSMPGCQATQTVHCAFVIDRHMQRPLQ